jgi:hypothetical protein
MGVRDNTFMFNSDVDYEWRVDNSAKMFLDGANGRLGIGNTSPDATMHIGDNSSSFTLGTTSGNSIDLLKLETDSTNANQLIFSSERVADGSDWTTTRERIYRKVDASNMGYIQFGSSFSASSNMIAFGEVGVAKYMGIGGDGRVTIGNNQDDVFGVLTIAKDANEEHLTLKTNYSNANTPRGAIKWRDGSNVTGAIHTEYDGTDVSMRFGSLYNSGYNTTTRMTLTGQGQLGIGTTSPGTKLHIQDNYDPDDSLGYVQIENTNTTSGSVATNSALTVKNYHGTSQFMQWEEHGLRIGSRILTNSGAGHLVFTAGADSEKMRIQAGGNIGIGTSSPSFKLKVNVDNASYTDWETIAGFQSKRGADSETEAGLMINAIGDAMGGQISSNWYWTDNVGAKGNTGRSAGIFGISNSANNESEFYWMGTAYNNTTLTTQMKLDNAQSLHVAADVVAYSTSVSDERFKDNIETIPNALDKVMQLRGVEFDWNATSRKGQHDIGVVAQEIEKVLPELVKEKTLCTGEFTDNEKEFKTVDYDKIVAVLIEAVKEQQQQIDELKKGNFVIETGD